MFWSRHAIPADAPTVYNERWWLFNENVTHFETGLQFKKQPYVVKSEGGKAAVFYLNKGFVQKLFILVFVVFVSDKLI